MIRIIIILIISGTLGVTYAQTLNKAEKFEQRIQREQNEYIANKEFEFAGRLKSAFFLYELYDNPAKNHSPFPEEVYAYNEPRGEPEKNATLIAYSDSLETSWNKSTFRQQRILFPDTIRQDSILVFTFFDQLVRIPFDKKMLSVKVGPLDEASLSLCWTMLGKTDFSSLVIELELIKKQLCLNDYGYLKLIANFSDRLSRNEEKLSRIIQWYLLVHSGYDVKIGYYNESAYLLIPSLQDIYGYKKMALGATNYFILENTKLTRIYTFPFQYDLKGVAADFNIYIPVNLKGPIKSKLYDFKYLDKTFPITLKYNTSVIDYYQDYPQTDLKVFFNAAVSNSTLESVFENFVPLIDTMEILDAANLLLSFVQKSFPYETDDLQFGKEKIFFPEEAIYYNNNDCDDRAVFFAFLIKTLLGIDVLGLEFSRHVAVALLLPGTQDGIGVKYNGKFYIVADPTIDDAPVGYFPGDMITDPPKGIHIPSNVINTQAFFKKYLKCLSPLKIEESSNHRNVFVDERDKVIISGSENNNESPETDSQNNYQHVNSAILACIDKYCNTDWTYRFNCSGMSRSLAINSDQEGNVYILGSFQGILKAGPMPPQTQNGKTDLFIASITPNGSLRWIKQFHLDTLPSNLLLNFACILKKTGENINYWFYDPHESQDQIILVAGDNNNLLINLPLSSINIGENKPSVKVVLTPEEQLLLIKKESDKMINTRVHPSIAGLLAVCNLMNSDLQVLSGKTLKLAFDTYNKDFRTKNPDLYNSLSHITLIKEDNGLIRIRINDGGRITLNNIKLASNTLVEINNLKNGHYQFSISQGAEFGLAIIWYDLNCIDIQPDTADMLFDFGIAHSKKKMNMQTDMLN